MVDYALVRKLPKPQKTEPETETLKHRAAVTAATSHRCLQEGQKMNRKARRVLALISVILFCTFLSLNLSLWNK